jgi:hypothetical protein
MNGEPKNILSSVVLIIKNDPTILNKIIKKKRMLKQIENNIL